MEEISGNFIPMIKVLGDGEESLQMDEWLVPHQKAIAIELIVLKTRKEMDTNKGLQIFDCI